MTAGDVTLIVWRDNTDLGYISYDNHINRELNKIDDWEYIHNENHPKGLKVVLSNGDTGVNNFLNSTFNKWSSGTAKALDFGMYVHFQIAPTSDGILADTFWGTIAELQPEADKGTLTLICDEFTERLEGIKHDKLIFTSYRDRHIAAHYSTTAGADYWALQLESDVGKVAPFNLVEFASNDTLINTYATATPDPSVFVYPIMAQKWLNLDYDALSGIKFWVNNGSGGAHTMTVRLMEDDGSGDPGTILRENTVAIGAGASGQWYTVNFYDVAQWSPYPLIPGRAYWIEFALNTGDLDTELGRDVTTPYVTFPFSKYFDGTNWHTANNESIMMQLGVSKYEVIDWKGVTWDGTSNFIFIKSSGAVVDNFATHYRGRVSYYYGAVYAATIATVLTGMGQPLSNDLSMDYLTISNLAKTFPVWRVGNNTVGDSIRELADTFCVLVTTPSTYAQAVTGFYKSSYVPTGLNHLKWSARQYLPTSASFMSVASPAAIDTQALITSTQNLHKTSKRFASVMVTGKDKSGLAIVAHRDDRALGTASYRTKSKLLTTEYITDDNIMTLEQANEVAKARLDLNSRDVWEGEITISGTYPDLMNLDSASSTFGSGQIITITHDLLGLSAVKFKVKGVRVTPNTTVVQLSNYDMLLDNKFTQSYQSAKRSESNIAPTDSDTQVFAKFFSPVIVTGATYYMELCTSASLPIGTRVLCTRMTDPTRNTIIYHAEFEEGNGVTTGAVSSQVAGAKLYDSATGVGADAVCALGDSYWFPKWTGTRVIADFATWDGT